MERKDATSRSATMRSTLPIAVLVILPLVGCGGQSCAQPIKIWPPLGNVEKAVQYINSRTCDVLLIEGGEEVFIRVGWETRGCWVAGANQQADHVNISVTPIECSMSDYFRTGLAIHEILHSIGHWHHDSYPGYGTHSVMEPVLGNGGWDLWEEDVNWIKERYCE
jgi:hypothetical protein